MMVEQGGDDDKERKKIGGRVYAGDGFFDPD